MPIGPGKYDDLCTFLRLQTKADSVILLVFNGDRGNGFEVQATLPLTLSLPRILRDMADQIEAVHGKGEL